MKTLLAKKDIGVGCQMPNPLKMQNSKPEPEKRFGSIQKRKNEDGKSRSEKDSEKLADYLFHFIWSTFPLSSEAVEVEKPDR